MDRVRYSLDEFIHDMAGLVESQPDQEKLFDIGSGHLKRLIINHDAIPQQYRVPVGTGGRANHGTYVLHRGDSGLTITAVVWGPGDHLKAHNHRTWGMIGVMDNGITETRFRRVDDRYREDYALLEKNRVNSVKPGDISLLIPDVDEIHQMDNFTDRPTVEIHVYGKDLVGLERATYDLETGKVTNFATKRYDNC